MLDYDRYATIFDSPFGKIGLVIHQANLTKLDILPSNSHEKTSKDPDCNAIVADIKAYLKNPKHVFQTNVLLKGTPFQEKVWRAIKAIPSGKTDTYGNLAKKLKTGPRAIGQACRTNPIAIIIPCHRIVAANHLGGYAGATEGSFFAAKKWMLRHEGLAL